MDKKPDERYISDLIQAAIEEFGSRDKQDALRDAMYWQENAVEHPSHIPDFQEVHFGLATENVERIRGILDDFPRTQVTPMSLADKEIKAATKVEDFLNTIFLALMDDEDRDVWDNIVEDVVRFGRGYDQLIYLPHARSSAAEDFPQQNDLDDDEYGKNLKDWKKRAKLPILWKHLPARSVFTWRDEEGISEAIVIEERRVRDLIGKYKLPDLAREVEHNPSVKFENAFFITYWNRTWCSYWVSRQSAYRDKKKTPALDQLKSASGQIADSIKHDYGFVPIVETPGITTTSRDSARSTISVIDHLTPLAVYLDNLLSQKGSGIRRWAWATPFTKKKGPGVANYPQPTSDDERPDPIDIIPGKMHFLMDGEDVGWFIPPEPGAGLDNQLEMVARQVDSLGISSSLFASGALQSNGYLYNSVMNAIRSKYSPIIKHIKRAHKQRCQQLLRIIEMYGEPLYLRKPGDGKDEVGEWIDLGPKDIKAAYYTMTVRYEDHLPTDDAADMAMAIQATDGENPLLDINTAREKYLRDESPERTQERVLIQKYAGMPEVQQFLMLRAVKKAKMFLDEQSHGPADELANLTEEQIMRLPPALLAQLGIEPQMPMAGMSGPPTSIPNTGAPAAPVLPGLTSPLVPTPSGPANAPRAGRNSANASNSSRVRKPAGRPAGQSRKPGNYGSGNKP